MLSRLSLLALGLLILLSVRAEADPRVTLLRIATVAPEGSAWARAVKQGSREVEQGTAGAVRIRWYFGGMAGNEQEVLDRMRRGQLDGVASAGMTCQQLAPSMRVLSLPGFYQSREEVEYVAQQLRPLFDQELRAAGYVNLGEVSLGPTMIFSRTPVRHLSELRRSALWLWDMDAVSRSTLSAMGVPFVPLPLEEAGTAYDEKRVDGFIGIPTAALAFQWGVRARYVTPLEINYLIGCFVVSQPVFDKLPPAAQQIARTATAHTVAQIGALVKQQDAALIATLFQRQGIRRLAVEPSFHSELFAAARVARERLGDHPVPRHLVARVQSMLAAFREVHGRH